MVLAFGIAIFSLSTPKDLAIISIPSSFGVY